MESQITREQEVAVLGATFSDEAAAIAATQDLGRLGLDDDDVRSAVWTDGRFVPDERAGANIWRSVVRIALIGIVVGTVVVTALSYVIWPGSSLFVLLIIGASFGGAVGMILGGYHGLNRKRGELWYEDDWRDATEVDGEVLVIFRPGVRTDQATQVVSRHGGRLLADA